MSTVTNKVHSNAQVNKPFAAVEILNAQVKLLKLNAQVKLLHNEIECSSKAFEIECSSKAFAQ